jgi:8-oxo-dGTP pyrophosphatase MutT (NUDIX family)
MASPKQQLLARARSHLSAHAARRAAIDAGGARAAVLVALFEVEGEARVWLIRRTEARRRHAGQVALPGGKVDPTDVDAVEAALREAREEIGLEPAYAEVLGLADDLVTSTGFIITPVVAWLADPFTPTPNAHEVARVFSAPWSVFEGEGVLGVVPIAALRDVARAYRVDGEVVWGATARILHTLARGFRGVE